MNKIKLALKLYGKKVVKEVIEVKKQHGYNFASRFFEDSHNKKYINCLELIF